MHYVYNGPVSSVTLRDKAKPKEPGTDVALFPGKAVDLPEDNPYVKTLKARGFLKEAAEETKAPPARAARKVKPQEVTNAG